MHDLLTEDGQHEAASRLLPKDLELRVESPKGDRLQETIVACGLPLQIDSVRNSVNSYAAKYLITEP